VRVGKACIARTSDPRAGNVGEPAAIACALLLAALVVGCGRSPRDEQPRTSQASGTDGSRQQAESADETVPIGSPAMPGDQAAASSAERPAIAAETEAPPAESSAIDAVLEQGGGEAAASLAQVATSDPDASVREEAVSALGDMRGIEARRAFELALIDPDREVRRAAIAGLAALGGDESARALAIVQSDSDARLRQDAVHALGEIGGATSTQLLRQALLDEDPAVRQAAAELLEQVPVIRDQ
jgi:HEAT repeats